MEKMITLSKDNAFGAFDNGSKRDAKIDEWSLEFELKRYFGWRTPTKRYKSFKARFYGLGSSDYDKFINYLIKKGY